MAVYRTTARQRRARQQQVLAQRRQLAWQVAHQAAVVLKEQFGARQVWVFGSLLHETLFHPRSDIDLAVHGRDGRNKSPFLFAEGMRPMWNLRGERIAPVDRGASAGEGFDCFHWPESP